ncbi:hypothetical protein OQA88_11646 [Cercophora sp. LCS_1]
MLSLRSIVTGALAMTAATASAAATPQQIADGLRSLTQKHQALQAPAQSITILNAPLIVIGQGPFPIIIAGYQDIVATGSALISQFPGTPAITGADADLVFNAFREHVRVSQATLNVLIGKAGLLTNVPVIGPPVATALRGYEGIIDTIAITLIDLAEPRAADLAAEANSLGATTDLAIQKYDGLSI